MRGERGGGGSMKESERESKHMSKGMMVKERKEVEGVRKG